MKKFLLITAFILTLITPAFADYVYKSSAVASYYADKFHGRKTSNGEIFNMYALTAAHKTLPFNTKVKVTNLSNGKSVIVRINDRGPFVKGREIDLSKAAASKLDMIKSGTAKVKLTIISSDSSGSTKQVEKWKTADKSTTWDIQLGAFSKRSNAEAMVKRLQDAGFKKYLAYQKVGNLTRVVIRDIATDDVQGYLDRLEKKGFTDYFVRERAKVKSSK
ncbi:MAG: septal ring lytic transglycosylase RlpA family protein [Treponema sp.]|nr:septal ring lytic transglycosylase RlpA family protein [Treponema sp.]